jgi:hypothetical protein
MPICKNCLSAEYYTGNEPSPKGLGICAKGYDITKDVGHTETGADGKSWTLRKQTSRKGTEFLIWRKEVTNLKAGGEGNHEPVGKQETLKASDYSERVTSNGFNAEGHVCRIGGTMKCLQIDKGGAKWWKKGTRSNSACQWDLIPPRDCHTMPPSPSHDSSSTAQHQVIVDLCALISKESVGLTETDFGRVRDILDFVLNNVRSGGI